MTASIFGTLRAMRGLEAAGIGAEQAEAIANAMHDAVTEGAVAKSDIVRLEVNVDQATADTKADTAGLETKIIMTILAAAGVVIAAMKYL